MTFVFFGSGDLATLLFEAFLRQGKRPLALVTLPDRIRGRGRKVQPLPIKVLAQEAGIPVFTPARLRDPEFLQTLRSLSPDFLFLCDYGKILPPEVLEIPKIAALNLHPSALPDYRGAAPIERALMAGERELGLTVIVMDPEVDTGAIVLQVTLPVGPEDTKGDLLPRIVEKGKPLLWRAAEGLQAGTLHPRPQPRDRGTYAKKIRPEETWLDLDRPAPEVVNQIRALSPKPGVRARVDGRIHKFLRARVGPELELPPWSLAIEGHRLFLGASPGTVEILELLPEGKRPMTVREYLAGHRPQRIERGSPHRPSRID